MRDVIPCIVNRLKGDLTNAQTLAMPLELFCKHTQESSPNAWTYIEDELFLPTRQFLRSDIGQSVWHIYMLIILSFERNILIMHIYFEYFSKLWLGLIYILLNTIIAIRKNI